MLLDQVKGKTKAHVGAVRINGAGPILRLFGILRLGIVEIWLRKTSPILGLPMITVFLALPVSTALILFNLLGEIFENRKMPPDTKPPRSRSKRPRSRSKTPQPPVETEDDVILWILLMFLMAFITAGIPIAFAIGIASLLVMIFFGGMPLGMIPQKVLYSTDSFVFLAVPFFILAGELMERGGISLRLVQFARCMVGQIRGGLGHGQRGEQHHLCRAFGIGRRGCVGDRIDSDSRP